MSTRSVPLPSGAARLAASSPAIASGPTIGRNRASSSTSAQLRFHQGVLSPRPSKPLPLFANAELYSYSTCDSPWKPGFEFAVTAGFARASAVKPSTSSGCSSRVSDASLISGASIFRPNSSGVRPTIRPATNTVRITNTSMLIRPTPIPPYTSFRNMPSCGTSPPSGVNESSMPFTLPLLVCVVSAAHSAVASAPRRTSLPSMFGPSADRPVRAAFGIRSASTAPSVRAADSTLMTPISTSPKRGRRRNRPVATTSASGNRMMLTVSSRFDSGVGFSSGTVEFGPYQPPPFVPSCLIATIGATGPTGMVCVVTACPSTV